MGKLFKRLAQCGIKQNKVYKGMFASIKIDEIKMTNIFSITTAFRIFNCNKPFMSLRNDIDDYRAEHAGMLHGAERFYSGLPFVDAITYGASAAGPHGKIDPHQRRIGVKRLRRSAKMLSGHLPEIQQAKSFVDLFVITEEVRLEIQGLGHLWSYDTALRIAFNRGTAFYPQAVFVQRGVVKGVRKIFTRKPAKGRTLPVDIFPKELQVLKPFELENFLCVWGKEKKV